MNPADPFYSGDMPMFGVFFLGVAVILIAGWVIERWKK